MQKLFRFSKCYFMENLKISVGCENSSFHFREFCSRMNLCCKLRGESMRKIWMRFSNPWCHPWVVSSGMSLWTLIWKIFFKKGRSQECQYIKIHMFELVQILHSSIPNHRLPYQFRTEFNFTLFQNGAQIKNGYQKSMF
jgi:hypothetical protein